MTSPRYPQESERGQPAPLQAVEPTLIIQRPSRRGPVIIASLVATLCAGIAITLLSGGEDESAGGERLKLVSSEHNPAADEPGAESPPAPETEAPAPGAGGETAAEQPAAGVAGARTEQQGRPRNRTNDRERPRALAQVQQPAPDEAAPGAVAGEATPETAGDEIAAAGREENERAGEDTGEEAAPAETAVARAEIQASPGGSAEPGSSPSPPSSKDSARRPDRGRARRRSAASRSARANAGSRPAAAPARSVAEPPPASPPPPPPRVKRDLRVPRKMVGDAGRGERLYGRCQSCHGKSAPGLSPRRYTQRQWRRYLASRRHGRHTRLAESFSLSELADVKAYLIENAADVDRGMAAGIR